MSVPCEEDGRDVLADLEEGIFIIILILLVPHRTFDHYVPAPVLPLTLEDLQVLLIGVALFKIFVPSSPLEGPDGSIGLPLHDIDRELVISPEQIPRLDRSRQLLPL